ncbi:hypothetical protein Tco_0470987 [Tanacetum coccineum]
MRYDSTTGIYSCQLDEQWFNLHKDILRDALQITPINDNDPFVAPPSSDAVIEYVNTLGYPVPSGTCLQCPLMISINHGEPSEFVQSIQSFFTNKKRLIMPSQGKKKTTPLLIQSIRFTKLIIHHLKTKNNIHTRTGSPLHYSHEDNVLGNLKFVGKDGREVFGMPIPNALLTDAIKGAPYYGGYLADVVEYQRYLDRNTVWQRKKQYPNLLLPKLPRFQPLPEVQGKGKEKVIEEQAARNLLTLQTLKKKSPADQYIFQRCTPMTTGPSGNVESPSLDAGLALADSETESDEIVTPVNKEKDASNKELTEINAGVQDEGQVGSNPSKQDKGQARANPGNATEFQPQPSHVVHAGQNLEPMDLAVSDASTQQNPEQMDEEFTITAYPNVQENLKLPTEDQVILEEPVSSTRTMSSLQNLEKELSFTDQFFMEKPQEEEPEKTNAKSEVQSMVTVPIHQDTSSVPLMTTPVIDLTNVTIRLYNCSCSTPNYNSNNNNNNSSTTTTSTITNNTYPILLQRIGELEQHMANLIQDKSDLEERLNKHGSRLYNLENLNIPQKVSKAIDEIITDVVDCAMQAPLRARFSDLPTV